MRADSPSLQASMTVPSAASDGAVGFETVPCPLCGSERYTLDQYVRELIFESGEVFSVVRCDACGHRFVNPRPTEQEIFRYYPADYAPHHNSRAELPPSPADAQHSDRQPWYLSPAVRRIPGLRRAYYWLTETNDVLLPEPPERDDPAPRVLELGCSDGDYLLQLKERGWQTVGIEPAAPPAERARQRGLDVRCGVLEPGMFEPASFDAFCAWHVIEHLHQPRQVLQEVSRILRPGAELLLSLPNFGCWEPRLFREYWYANQPPIHLQHFTPRSLRRLLDTTGFEVVQCLHQRNLSYVVGSVGLWLRDKRLFPGLTQRLLRYPDTPTLAGQLALAIPARVLAACRQGGRITVRARRRNDSGAVPST
jgi:SAM-dependent methyltransferase